MLFLFAGISFSCIREGLDMCPVEPDPNPVPYEVRFSFDYPQKDSESGIGFDPAEVETIEIYVFNEDNKYIGTFTDDNPHIADKNYFFTVPLDPGSYNFIVYGNLKDCYRTEPVLLQSGITHLDDINYYYTEVMDNRIVNHPKHLFYSSLYNAIVTKSSSHYTLPLVRDTYVLNIIAEGLPTGYDDYQFAITDTNWKYTFENSFLPCEELEYVQNCTFEPSLNQYGASFTTLRLDRDRYPELKLYNKKSGELIYRDALIPLILKIEEQGGKVDFTKMYEFDIHLLFETDPLTGNLTVDISINGWSVIEKDVIIELG